MKHRSKKLLSAPISLKANKMPIWDDIILPLNFRRHLQRSLVSAVLENGKPTDYSFIIFGPPGTGKTTITKSITKQLGWRYCYVAPQDFFRPGDTVEDAMKQIFEEITDMVEKNSKLKPSNIVFVFDEIDELVVAREGGSDRQTRLSTTMMLPLLQNLRNLAKDKNFVFFVLTNHIERFDPAIIRQGRFDLILPLGPPDRYARFLLFEKYLDEIGEEFHEKYNVIFRKEWDLELDDLAFKQVTADLDVISRASAKLNLEEIQTICRRVIEQAIAMQPSIRESIKSDIPGILYLHTRYFIDWIYKYRHPQESKKEIEKFYKDLEIYSRGSTLYPKPHTLQEKIEHEFSSIHIKHNLSRLGDHWKINQPKIIKFSFRNLAGYGFFTGNIKAIATIGNLKREKVGSGVFNMATGVSSEEYKLKLTPNVTGKLKISFIVSGHFDLLGIEDVLVENSAKIHGELIYSREIKVN